MELEQIGLFKYQRFRPHLPPVSNDGRDMKHHSTIIVGGGPVGLATALGLARWGLPSVVIEADDSVCEGSRAACISRRSLEILDRFGVVRPFLDKGLAWSCGRSYYGEEEVFRLEMPSSPSDKFPPMINIEQYYIEQFLLDEIERVVKAQPGLIEIRWASKVTKVSQANQSVSVAVENELGRYEMTGDWLVATDGGQSFIRNSLGLELKGVGYQGRYAIVDIELESTSPTERRAWFDPPWAKGTTILMHRQPDNIWRVDYQLSANQDSAKVLEPDQLRHFVQTHLDAIGEGHLKWKPVWTSIYRAGAMTLDSYRHGRILFAGNSAHAMPIFGVRGLNSGFDDADNLIWKLAGVIKGKAGQELLDTYSRERIHAFHVNAENAMRSTEFMSPPNRGFELMREAALSLALRHRGIARLVNPRQTHAITYANSDLSAKGDPFHQGPVPGSPLPEALLKNGQHLTDSLAKQGFTLLVFGELPDQQALNEEILARGDEHLPLKVVSLPAVGSIAVAYGARTGSTYLIRPDGHVCGRWHSPAASTLIGAMDQASQLTRSEA